MEHNAFMTNWARYLIPGKLKIGVPIALDYSYSRHWYKVKRPVRQRVISFLFYDNCFPSLGIVIIILGHD